MASITYETCEQYFSEEYCREQINAVNEIIMDYRKTNNDYTTDREEIIEFLGL